MLNKKRVEQLLSAFGGKNVIVLGDVMLDEFVWGKVRRISPEAPVPVVEVLDETYRLGGSANVAANIHELGGTPIPIGVIGRDRAGDRVIELMRSCGVETSGLIHDDRPTTLKTRILAHNQQIARADRESRAALSEQTNRAVADAYLKALAHAKAVVVSDYDKGVANRALLNEILPKTKAAGIPVFLDPKVMQADYYTPITAITPNHREAELLTGVTIDSRESLDAVGRKLLSRFDCEYALITRGEEGMSLFDRSSAHHLPTFAREVFDVTGAGDTVIATLALACAGGATMEEAAILANHAAGIAVGKIGIATVSPAELLSDFDERNARPAN
jgi:rfaE bifunctional protein kinase chain/domain